MPSRAATLVALVLGLAITGCGGGSSSTPSSQTSAAARAAEPKPLPGHPKIATKPSHHRGAAQPENNRYGSFTRAGAAAEHRAKRRQRAAHRKLARKAGKAAPFLVSEGDNSIPTYGSEATAGDSAAAEAALTAYLRARATVASVEVV